MSGFTVATTLLVSYFCCVAMGWGDGQPTGGGGMSGSGGGVASPKNVRILSPAAVKLYRMIRKSVDDDDMFADDGNVFRKRQFDDYGHMRFGKRNPQDFDDYGHLRFGK